MSFQHQNALAFKIDSSSGFAAITESSFNFCQRKSLDSYQAPKVLVANIVLNDSLENASRLETSSQEAFVPFTSASFEWSNDYSNYIIIAP